ncbi:Uma2 family endonuclease, partial [Streptomyces sp. TRM76130]|nr:Uma2 family endonuclease [Streptomyces sp. TRM76130]
MRGRPGQPRTGVPGRSATMTVVDDRIAMADVSTESLDEWFERLEKMPVPEGFR